MLENHEDRRWRGADGGVRLSVEFPLMKPGLDGDGDFWPLVEGILPLLVCDSEEGWRVG